MEESLFKRSELRASGKTFWAGLLRACGLLALAKLWVRRRGGIVLTFHRVLDQDELPLTASLPGMVVTRKTFDGFLKYAAENCAFIDLSGNPDLRPGSRLKLAITFDDGWADNAAAAFPIAQKYQAPLVIFIVPEKMGTDLPFWPERAFSVLDTVFSVVEQRQNRNYIEQTIEKLKALPTEKRNQRIEQLGLDHAEPLSSTQVDRTMTWEQIAELHRAGVTFGSHSSTHEILTAIPLAQAEKEVTGSREMIEQRLEALCNLFAYPNGDYSEEVCELVQEAGYRYAFLNQDPGVWTRECDPYRVPRVNVCEYHLVDTRGSFSPLIFDYAVVWNAAKGLMAKTWADYMHNLRRKFHGAPRLGPSAKKSLEKSS